MQERRRRGKAETQTSDARFDERFKLGHAMAGKANTPWYAAGGSTLPTEELRCAVLSLCKRVLTVMQ